MLIQKALGDFIGIKTPETQGKDINITKFNLTPKNIIGLMKSTAPNCNDFIKNCTWNSVQYPCSKLFKIVSTDDGFCCTFNAVPAKETLSGVG